MGSIAILRKQCSVLRVFGFTNTSKPRICWRSKTCTNNYPFEPESGSEANRAKQFRVCGIIALREQTAQTISRLTENETHRATELSKRTFEVNSGSISNLANNFAFGPKLGSRSKKDKQFSVWRRIRFTVGFSQTIIRLGQNVASSRNSANNHPFDTFSVSHTLLRPVFARLFRLHQTISRSVENGPSKTKPRKQLSVWAKIDLDEQTAQTIIRSGRNQAQRQNGANNSSVRAGILPMGTTSGTTKGAALTSCAVSRCPARTPPGSRTPNLLIKRTLHAHTHGRKWAHIKDIAKPVPSVDATEYPQDAARRHDMRHDTSPPLPGGHARRAAA